MTQRGRITGPPRSFLASGTWPEGTLRADAPVGAGYAAAISRNLAVAIAGMNKSALAEQTDLARSTIHDILTGRTWPDLVTLAKLEDHLDVRLWPR